MASSDDEQSESGSYRSEKDVNMLESNFKCCVKKKCKIKICINCDGIYHNSCSEKKNIQTLSRRYVKCCDKTDDETLQKSNREEILELKIKHLNELLSQEKEKNQILKENSQLLKENNRLLKEHIEKMETKKVMKKDTQYLDIAKRNYQTVTENKATPQIVVQMSENTEHDKRQENTNLKKVNQQQTRNAQIQGKPTIINEAYNSENKADQISEYTVVQRKKKYPRKRLGTGEVTEEEMKTGFSGPERKVWINIYRVNNHVTADMIEKYIKQKNGFENENVSVSELDRKAGQYKSFCVTASLSKKDEMYEPTFWPPNVGIRRFKFDLHKNSNGGAFFRQGNIEKQIHT